VAIAVESLLGGLTWLTAVGCVVAVLVVGLWLWSVLVWLWLCCGCGQT
jgi:hypothetical protein